MSKRRKLLFHFSIGLNIVLIAMLTWSYIKMNFANDLIFIKDVQNNLVELEGLIANQMDKGWPEPNLVTTELGDVLEGLQLGLTIGGYAGTLSQTEKEVLQKLHSKLRQYPHDELYKFTEVSEEDRQNFVELRAKLRNAGLGMSITISEDMDYFMKQAEQLEKDINVPLNL
ncbi:hypothetical protein [Bacillus sp. FJAT-27445]|uniref:hypothetical protein n=1 Tax=Bacillus sp. FJAT-27445 TaxID=1679166 RepID=UPI0007442BF1|nr:hypothetical protein [Bacillus sp. FJAT-27445]